MISDSEIDIVIELIIDFVIEQIIDFAIDSVIDCVIDSVIDFCNQINFINREKAASGVLSVCELVIEAAESILGIIIQQFEDASEERVDDLIILGEQVLQHALLVEPYVQDGGMFVDAVREVVASFPGSTPQLFSHRVEKRGGSLVYFITCYVT